MVIDDWVLGPTPLEPAGITEMAEAIRNACGDEAAAVNGRVNMRIVAMLGREAVASIGYVLTGAATSDLPDDDLEAENGDQSVSASLAKSISSSQRHVERMVQLASMAMTQAAESQRYAIHHLRQEVEALRGQEAQVVQERLAMAQLVAAKIIGEAEKDAEAIKASSEGEDKSGLLKLLGGGIISRMTGNPDSAMGALLGTLTPDQKAKIFSALTPEQQAALYMAMPPAPTDAN